HSRRPAGTGLPLRQTRLPGDLRQRRGPGQPGATGRRGRPGRRARGPARRRRPRRQPGPRDLPRGRHPAGHRHRRAGRRARPRGGAGQRRGDAGLAAPGGGIRHRAQRPAVAAHRERDQRARRSLGRHQVGTGGRRAGAPRAVHFGRRAAFRQRAGSAGCLRLGGGGPVSTLVTATDPAARSGPATAAGDLRRRRQARRRWRTAATALAFLAPSLVLLLAFWIGPMLGTVWVSLQEWNLLGRPRYAGLENYRELVTDDGFHAARGHTAACLAGYLGLVLVFGLAVALLLDAALPAMTLFRAMFFLPVITSWVAVSLLWKWLLNPAEGVVNRVI